MIKKFPKAKRGLLVFKKAFDIPLLPVESSLWLSELKGATFEAQSNDLKFTIETGQVGINDNEKRAIGRFLHSDERNPRFITPIPTLNISLHISCESLSHLDEEVFGSADTFVEHYVLPAYVALQHFIESYRDVKFRTSRNDRFWHSGLGIGVPEMPLREFKTFLFYSLTLHDRVFAGSFSQGKIMLGMQGDRSFCQQVRISPKRPGVPLARVLIARAWDHFFGGDFRSAVVESATVIELCLAQICKKQLLDKKVASENRVTTFVSETSNRLLITIIGGLFGIESDVWREGVANTLDVRHGLVHGRKRYASHGEAESALTYAERLLTLSEKMGKKGVVRKAAKS